MNYGSNTPEISSDTNFVHSEPPLLNYFNFKIKFNLFNVPFSTLLI